MTEDKARTKWCPMFRMTSAYGITTNRPFDYEIDNRCIASDCMMWRWSDSFDDGTKTPRVTFGYCGIGGKP